MPGPAEAQRRMWRAERPLRLAGAMPRWRRPQSMLTPLAGSLDGRSGRVHHFSTNSERAAWGTCRGALLIIVYQASSHARS